MGALWAITDRRPLSSGSLWEAVPRWMKKRAEDDPIRLVKVINYCCNRKGSSFFRVEREAFLGEAHLDVRTCWEIRKDDFQAVRTYQRGENEKHWRGTNSGRRGLGNDSLLYTDSFTISQPFSYLPRFAYHTNRSKSYYSVVFVMSWSVVKLHAVGFGSHFLFCICS